MNNTFTAYNIDDLISHLKTIRDKNPNIALGHEMNESQIIDLEHGIHIVTDTVVTTDGIIECLIIK